MLMLARLGYSILAAIMLMTSVQATLIVIFISVLFSMRVVVGQRSDLWYSGLSKIGVILYQDCACSL